MALGIAVSGDRFMNCTCGRAASILSMGRVRQAYGNQRGGRRDVRQALRRLSIRQDDGRRHAGRAGRVHQAPVADGLRSLSDNLVPGADRRSSSRRFTLKRGRRRPASARATRTPRRARPTASTGPGRGRRRATTTSGLDGTVRRARHAMGATRGAWGSRADAAHFTRGSGSG